LRLKAKAAKKAFVAANPAPLSKNYTPLYKEKHGTKHAGAREMIRQLKAELSSGQVNKTHSSLDGMFARLMDPAKFQQVRERARKRCCSSWAEEGKRGACGGGTSDGSTKEGERNECEGGAPRGGCGQAGGHERSERGARAKRALRKTALLRRKRASGGARAKRA
jgi:hypothetical protein